MFWGFVNLLISSGANIAGPYYFGLVINDASDGDRSGMNLNVAYLGNVVLVHCINCTFNSNSAL
jgi:hypothetical protein